jgi:conjugal transfer pilus assembly protein TraW
MQDPPATARQAGWGVVLVQTITVAVMLMGALLIAATAKAATATIGRTWPIAEPDALAEIEGKASRLPPMTEKFGPRSQWTAMKAATLEAATANRSRTVVPFYTLDFDIRLPGGQLLYPKGYSYNPLSFVTLPQRLIVVHPRDLRWALGEARASDFILLTAGDALALGEKIGRPLYILEERVKQRLGLTVAPVIVRQIGQTLQLTEVRLARRPGTQRADRTPQRSSQ